MAAMTAIMIGLMVASIVTTTVAQHKAGEAQAAAGEHAQEAANSEANLADYNAAVARLQAQDAIQRGADEENRFRSKIRGVIGTQRAGIAAGNIDVSYGSAADVQGDAAQLGELDALTIRTNSAREAWGYNIQAENLTRQADIARKTGVYAAASGREAANASNYAVAGTILGGAGSLLQARYGFTNASRTPQNQYITSPYSGYGVLA